MADIFVSYTSCDRQWAFWIGQELAQLGHVPHIHEWELSAGGNIPKWMDERLKNADHCLLVVGKTYLQKDYSSWELHAAQWAAASKRSNFALPVFIEECEPPILLAPFNRCDLYQKDETEARAALTEFLKPAKRPTTPQLFPVTSLTSRAFPGPCRITLPLISSPSDQVKEVFNYIHGYWELYHYSFSKEQQVSISLLHINEISDGIIRFDCFDHVKGDDDGVKRNINTDTLEPTYKGWCLEGNRFLHFIFQDESLREYKLLMVHWQTPRRNDTVLLLFGLVLTSNGINGSDALAAGRVACRRIGATPEEALNNCIIDLRHVHGGGKAGDEDLLKVYVGDYIDNYNKPNNYLRKEPLKQLKEKILPCIRNSVSEDARPFALLMAPPWRTGRQ